MSQPTTWGVPRTDGGNEYTPEQFAERADDSFDALLSLHKGNSRPAYAEAGTLWLDDSSTPWVMKLFDGSDDITIGTVNPSDNKFTPSRAVLYEAQTLDSSQKAQARANINAPERIVLDVVAPGGAGVGGAVPLSLSNNKAYTIRLNTLGTGARTGAVYNLWQESLSWQLKRLSGISGSNHPELRLNSNGDGLEVFTQHENSYTIRLHIDIWDTNNSQGIAESFFAGPVSMPVGSTYIQMPGEAAPSTLFGGTWSLLFSNEGIFFRTEGGNASSFGGGIQEDELKSHTHSGSTNSAGEHTHSIPSNDSGGSSTNRVDTAGGAAISHNLIVPSAGAHTHTLSINATGGSETRPRNRTVRVWKRTA